MKKTIAGVDEVGRGSLIGPVFAAAVIFKKNINKKMIKDSKKLSKEKRKIIEKHIKKNSVWSIGSASLREIEKLNILNASLLAMKRSIKKLRVRPSLILIDGNKLPHMTGYKLKSIIKGDQKISEISAASIIAKVYRDKFMIELHHKYPKYNFQKNKGYPTKDHIQAIRELGPSPYHRLSFKPELYENES